MPELRRSTVRDLRRDNRSMLLSSLYFGQPCSRQDLSIATGLSPASVSNVIRELIGEGIVLEAGSEDSDGGRPRVLLEINPDYGYVIGVDVGETRVRAELFDLAMTERASADYPLDPRQHGVEVIVDAILTGLAAVLASAGVDSSAVLGVGVGVPVGVGVGAPARCAAPSTAPASKGRMARPAARARTSSVRSEKLANERARGPFSVCTASLISNRPFGRATT